MSRTESDDGQIGDARSRFELVDVLSGKAIGRDDVLRHELGRWRF